jgi:hypothetical protein
MAVAKAQINYAVTIIATKRFVVQAPEPEARVLFCDESYQVGLMIENKISSLL